MHSPENILQNEAAQKKSPEALTHNGANTQMPSDFTLTVPSSASVITATDADAVRATVLAQAEHLKLICLSGKRATLSQNELKDIRPLFAHTVNPSAKPKDQADAVLQACLDPGLTLPVRRKGWRPQRMAIMLIDIDSGNLPIEGVMQLAAGFFGLDVIASVYSSASASESDRRWRIAVPLNRPTETPLWLQGMKAFGMYAQARGITIDKSLFTLTQPVFLPNVPGTGRHPDGTPIFYQQCYWGHRLVDLTAIPYPIGAQAMRDQAHRDAEVAAAAAQRKAQAETRYAQREAERAKLMAEGKVSQSPIELFNALHVTADLLTKYGFVEDVYKPGHWHHPELQSTASYATQVLPDGHWITKSGTLRVAGLGTVSASGETNHGDAFDLFQFFEHDNNRTAAVKGVARALGMPPVGKATPADVSAFEAVPLPEGVHPFGEGESGGAPPILPPMTPPKKVYRLTSAAEFLDQPPVRWMLRDVLPCEGVCMVYGPSRAGKTFAVLDLAMHLLSPSETTWFDRAIKNRPAGVVYAAMEDPAGVRGRIRAWAQEHDCDVPSNLHFFDGQGFNLALEVDAAALAVAILATVGEGALLIVDTQAKASAGAEEQSAKDMGVIYANIERIAQRIKGVVMPIAHAGKDEDKGARGSSAQVAACDMVICIKRNGEMRQWLVEKNKNGPEGTFGWFSIASSVIGVDSETGEDLTAGYVMPTCKPMETKAVKGNAKLAHEAFAAVMESTDADAVSEHAWRGEFDKRYKAKNPEAKPKTYNTTFNRALQQLIGGGQIYSDSTGLFRLGMNTAAPSSDDLSITGAAPGFDLFSASGG